MFVSSHYSYIKDGFNNKKDKDLLFLTNKNGEIIVEKVNKEFKKQLAKKDLEQLKGLFQLKKCLNKRVKIIHSKTQGIFNFFRLLFNPKVKEGYKNEKAFIETLKTKIKIEINNTLNNLKIKFNELEQKPLFNPAPQVIAPAPTRHPNREKFNHQVQKIEKIPHKILHSVVKIPHPIKKEFRSEQTVSHPQPPVILAITNHSVRTQSSNNSVKVPPPPPPMLSKSPQEKHMENEKRRLERLLNERSDPNEFYEISKPKNEMQLDKQKQKLMNEINIFKELLRNFSNELLENLLRSKEKELEEINQLLQGTLKPLKGHFFKHDKVVLDENFSRKAGRLTYDEIQFILGMAYEGVEPVDTYRHYKTYVENKEIFDDIFRNWEKIVSAKSREFFLKHKDQWKKTAEVHITAFLLAIKERACGKSKEPSYDPITFEEAQKIKKSIPLIKSNSVSSDQNQALIEELKGKVRLRKGSNTT